MILELKHGEQEFTKLKQEWNELENDSKHPTPNLTHNWLSLWWNIFKNNNDNKTGHDKELYVLVGKKDNKLCLLIPILKLKRKYGLIKITFLEFLSQQWSAFYCDMLASGIISSDDVRKIMEYIKNHIRHDVLFFNHLPQNSYFSKNYQIYPYAACPVLDLTLFKDFEDYKTTQYSKNLKNNFVKAFSWAKKNNQTIQLTTSCLNETMFSEIKKIAYSKIIDGKAYKYQDTAKENFRKHIGLSAMADLDYVMINDKIVSYRTNVILRNTKFGMDASYNREFRHKYQLGALAVEQSIRNCFKENISYLDFGPGIDDYKFKFTQKIKLLNYLVAKGNTWRSFIIHPIMKLLVSIRSKKFLLELKEREIEF